MKKTTPPLQTVTVHDEDLAQRCARGRVVVIDDDKDVLDALCALIHMAGYACESYSSGLTYLQVLSYNQPCFPGPCCILCDVKMPELSGLELQQRLARLDDTPLLVMSGSSGVSEAVTAFRQGVLDFFTKPVDADTLLAGIDKALRLSTERQQHNLHQRLLLPGWRP